MKSDVSVRLFVALLGGVWGALGPEGADGSDAVGADRPAKIDVVAAQPRPETELVELEPVGGRKGSSPTRAYRLLRLPTGERRPTLRFIAAGGYVTGAEITARSDEAGLFTSEVFVDKGQSITFSVRVRAEGVARVALSIVPVRRNWPAFQRGGPPVARTKPLTAPFDWTTLRLETLLTANVDRAQFQVLVRGAGTVWIEDFRVATPWPRRVEIPAKPAAPLYVMVLMHSETPQAYIRNRSFFEADATKIEKMARMLHRYGARLVMQPERELWLGAKRYDAAFIRRLRHKYGVSFSVHTHGPNPRLNPTPQQVVDYIRLRKEELEAMGAGPVTDLNGNFDQPDWDIFADVGIRTLTAYKNVRTQQGQEAMKHYYLHPWRPAGSPYDSEEKWATHRPDCRVVYLPGAGAIHTRHHEQFAELMERHLRVALSRVRADRINVFYFVEHVGRFVPRQIGTTPWQYVRSKEFREDLAQHEKLFRDFLAPLVRSGHVRYAVPSEVCDLFEQWEQEMGIAARPQEMAPSSPSASATSPNPRPPQPFGTNSRKTKQTDTSPSSTTRTENPTPFRTDVEGYITFAINIHDWLHVDDSANVLLKLIDLFEKYGVRGDFYLTAPIVHFYVERRPDLIRRLRDSKMTISYHVRPPHILYPGFNQHLLEMDDDEIAETIEDYESYRLDLSTGRLIASEPGGYTFVASTFGRKPVALGVPTPTPRIRRIAREVYRRLGARVIVEHHETGTKMDRPFEYVDGLLMRPSDFSVTRWTAPGDRPGPRGRGNFWWNMLSTPRAADYAPVDYLKKRLAVWSGPRPPFITCLIHENNFYRGLATPWALVYYADRRKTRPRQPPFDLSAPDASTPRSPADRERIWQAYEKLVAYAAQHLIVVTSEDVARMAPSPHSQ